MKNYQPKPLNAIQQTRAPQTVSDESFSELKEQRAEAGESFRNELFTGKNPETGTESKTWFDRTSGKWIAEFHFTDGSTDRLEANSRDDLLLAVATGYAQTVVEDHEAELEANPIFESDYEGVVFQWLRYGKFGQEFDELSKYLPQSDVDKMAKLIKRTASKMYGRGSRLDARCIEGAYIELLDAGILEPFERCAAIYKERHDAKVAKDAERDALAEDLQQRSEAGYQQAVSEYEQAEAAKRIEADKKLSKTKKGMAELRRRALFGDKENAFPVSTGTARRN